MSLSVSERDALTIRDAVQLFAGWTVRDWRGNELVRPRTYSTNRAFPNATGVNSYGAHFPLFRYVRPNRSRGPAAPLFLINGDRWTGPNSRTNDHQRATRDAIAATGLASAVIPFNALAGAGIDLDSIRVIHTRPDENWTETRYAETLAEVPRHERTVSYSVEHEAGTLAEVPERERNTYRGLTDSERAERIARGEHAPDYATYLPVLPDADGLYRWREYLSRPLEPDADGLYSWEVRVHRLGDCLFSAVREITEPDRPADPFEHGRDTARERVELGTSDGRRYCETAGADADYAHEAGPAGACIHCGESLTARVVWRRRARYLSSFDTNENPPLYFLAEVPRGAGDTVETAIDALAPRAVHAAIARGIDVKRQGDIFLVATDLTDADLAARGIRSRARITQWTRGARARRGETGYSAPLTAADRRELIAIARRLYRRERRELIAGAAYPLDPLEHARRRVESREEWRALLARQSRERDAATAADVDVDADAVSGACDQCGAAIGAACEPATVLERRYAKDYGAGFLEARHDRRPLAEVHSGQRTGLRRRTLRGRERSTLAPLAPRTDAGARGRFAVIRADYARDVADARERLRRATFASGRAAIGYSERRARLYPIQRARESFERVLTRGPAGRDSLGNRSRAMARDSYRRAGYSALGSPPALALWRDCLQRAHERLRPDLYGARLERTRERVRDAVSIYGTAHSATEVLTVRAGATYVRGIARHVPDIEPDRRGAPDHAPVYLGDGTRWYLAVRNTVPRQSDRRRRRPRQLQLQLGEV